MAKRSLRNIVFQRKGDVKGASHYSEPDSKDSEYSPGDNVTFVVENGRVMVVNSAIHAMRLMQSEMSDISMIEDEIQKKL